MTYCVLSIEETARLENYGIFPVCRAHRHVKRAEAEDCIAKETHRFVGGANTAVNKIGVHSMITEVNTSRIWTPVACHAYNGRPIQGMRTWGLSPAR
jgi:hypothetical protein